MRELPKQELICGNVDSVLARHVQRKVMTVEAWVRVIVNKPTFQLPVSLPRYVGGRDLVVGQRLLNHSPFHCHLLPANNKRRPHASLHCMVHIPLRWLSPYRLGVRTLALFPNHHAISVCHILHFYSSVFNHIWNQRQTEQSSKQLLPFTHLSLLQCKHPHKTPILPTSPLSPPHSTWNTLLA